MNQEFRRYFGQAKTSFLDQDFSSAYADLDRARTFASSAQKKQIDELASRYNAPPEVEIVLEPSEVSWESPVRFTCRASDKEQDPVRALKWDFGDGQSSNKESPEYRYAKWDGSLKHKTYTVILNATDGYSAVTARKKIKVTSGPTPEEMRQKLLQFGYVNSEHITWKSK